jgi:hypothetical protein
MVSSGEISRRLMHAAPKNQKYLHFSQVDALFPLIKFSLHFFNSNLDKENIKIIHQ